MATSSRIRRAIFAAGAVSVAAFGLVRAAAPERALPMTPEMTAAAHLMNDAISVVAEYRSSEAAGVEIAEAEGIDGNVDPNRTGLVGPQYSPLFTSVGHLEAKRTTTVPEMICSRR